MDSKTISIATLKLCDLRSLRPEPEELDCQPLENANLLLIMDPACINDENDVCMRYFIFEGICVHLALVRTMF